MMRVKVGKIKDIPGEVMRVETKVPPGVMEDGNEEVVFTQPLRLELELTGTGSAILAEGTVKTAVQLSCARCLKPFSLPIEAPFGETYYPAGPEQKIHREEWISFEDEVIDLRPEVMETILIALPMKAVCREDCRGLCPSCGQNLNTGDCNCRHEKIDPRLAVLMDLAKHKET